MEVAGDLKSRTAAEFAGRDIGEGSKISSDAYSSYKKAFSEGNYIHEPKKFDKTDGGHLKWLHTIVSNAKSFILGTYHGLADIHFQAYLDEFCYWFNRRSVASELFNRLVYACISTGTVTRDTLYGHMATETG
ncbi:MAG: IS1595 family transposase [Treponema sp.]|nr:IS1595 family transposase [Treponema sp.]